MGTPEYFQRRSHPVAILLLPFSFLFYLLSALRRLFYRLGLKRVHKFSVPVIVVGNITVGGSGKTPLVIWLCNHLRKRGHRPGVVMRGHGGKAEKWPQQVRGDSDPKMVGDEAVVIARGTGCPVAASPDRVDAVNNLIAHADVDLVISDDGLQHYAMARDVEIVVVDGERRLGNGFLLPAGPLREGHWRLKKADFVVVNGCDDSAEDENCMTLSPGELVNLRNGETGSLASLTGSKVRAVAGLGNPARFFNMLEEAGLEAEKSVFPDHHAYSPADLSFDDDLPVIMTEKDAVKCQGFASGREWYLQLQVVPDGEFTEAITKRVEDMKVG